MYAQRVIEDAKNNPQKINYAYKIVRSITPLGVTTLVVEAVVNVSRDLWQVHEVDIENLTKVKFSSKIEVRPDEIITKSLPTQLCLVFNGDKQTYDRCTESEEVEAKSLTQSLEEVKNSPECGGNVDPFTCGENRDKAGLTAGKDRTRAPDSDNTLPPGIY